MDARASAFDSIAEPILPDAPCGPDPDDDPQILNYLSVIENQLPTSYRDFNKKNFNARPVLERLQSLLAKSRDLRFLTLMAKYHILSDNFAGFADTLVAVHALLVAQWSAVHPTEKAGGDELRAAYLSTLDDMPTVIMPLQNVPIITDKRLGPLSARSIQLANKKIAPQSDEKPGDPAAILSAFQRHEPLEELVAFKNRAEAVKSSLAGLHQLFVDKVNFETAPSFNRLPQAIDAILVYINPVIVARSEVVAPVATNESGLLGSGETEPPSAGTAAASSVDDMVSMKEAGNALEAVLAYFAVSEPSSPARLMIKQARQLVGKTFVEAMQVLAPNLAQQAKINIGGESPFTLDFTQLMALAQDEFAPDDQSEVRSFSVNTRQEALALMANVEKFFKRTEPSSPIPLLIDRARNFASKDFASLLKEMVKQNES